MTTANDSEIIGLLADRFAQELFPRDDERQQLFRCHYWWQREYCSESHDTAYETARAHALRMRQWPHRNRRMEVPLPTIEESALARYQDPVDDIADIEDELDQWLVLGDIVRRRPLLGRFLIALFMGHSVEEALDQVQRSKRWLQLQVWDWNHGQCFER